MFATETDRIEHNMTVHPPESPAVVAAFESLREAAKAFAHTIDAWAPGCREKSLALTAAEDALQYAIAAVARNQGRITEIAP